MKRLLALLFLCVACGKAEDLANLNEDPITKTGSRCTTGGETWDYCMYRYPNSSRDLLFYFHDFNGKADDWRTQTFEKNILRYWEENNIAPPVVVSISFGKNWLLSSGGFSTTGGTLDTLLSEVIPVIEQKFSDNNIDNIYLFGRSMGGFNAGLLYLKRPSLFSRVALACPAMTTISPYANSSEIQQYLLQSKADPQRLQAFFKIAKESYSSHQAWLRHSPVNLAPSEVKSNFPPLYVTNGTADEYGFYPGAFSFLQSVRANSAPATSAYEMNAGHCAVNASQVAHFLKSQ